MDATPIEAPSAGYPTGYRFAGCELDLRARVLVTGGRSQHVERKTFELLQYLILHRDRAVTKQELNQALWGGCAVSDGALTQCVWTARRAINSDKGRRSLIQTLNGVGYRFVGDVTVTRAPPVPEESSPTQRDDRLAVEALSHLTLVQGRVGAGTTPPSSDEDYLLRAAVACRRFADAILGGFGVENQERSLAG